MLFALWLSFIREIQSGFRLGYYKHWCFIILLLSISSSFSFWVVCVCLVVFFSLVGSVAPRCEFFFHHAAIHKAYIISSYYASPLEFIPGNRMPNGFLDEISPEEWTCLLLFDFRWFHSVLSIQNFRIGLFFSVSLSFGWAGARVFRRWLLVYTAI